MAPLITLVILAIIIYFLGTGRFGRAQTQAWIDRARKIPWLFRLLDKHHGKFRASGHYFEFGGLFLVTYWCWDSWVGDGSFHFHTIRAVIIAVFCAVAAYLDELHQLQSGTRQFRREDFLHSLCGITIAAAIVMYQDFLRMFL